MYTEQLNLLLKLTVDCLKFISVVLVTKLYVMMLCTFVRYTGTFIVAPSMAALLCRKPASAGASSDSCSAQDSD